MSRITYTPKRIKVALFSQEALLHQLDAVACNANFRGGLGRLIRCFLYGLMRSHTIDYRCCVPLHARPWKDPEFGPINYEAYGPIVYATRLWAAGREFFATARALSGESQVLGIECPEVFDVLYNDIRHQRWLQEVVFSRVAVAALKATGFVPDVAWINDTHPAVAAASVQAHVNPDVKILYTTHTQQGAARECYYGAEWHWEDTGLPDHYLPIFVTESGKCDFSHAASVMAHVINAVSREHEDITKREVYPVWAAKTTSVTNHICREWQLGQFQAHAAGNFANLSDEELLQIHVAAKERLLSTLERYDGRAHGSLDRKKLWAGMIRRPAGYKNMCDPIMKILPALCGERGRMYMTECGELEGLEIGLGVAFLPAPQDKTCCDWMKWYHALTPYFREGLVYLADYSRELIEAGTQGSDVWVEIPLTGHEGCGTSGQQSARNGIPTISTMGGGNIEWIEEYSVETGKGNGLYMKLDTDALSLYAAFKKMSDLYYAFMEQGDPNYLRLMRNVLMAGEGRDVHYAIEKYERIFEYLMAPIEA